MYKTYCCVISILFFGICFSGNDLVAGATDATKYISNRVKIIRPEKMVETSASISSDTIDKEVETTIVVAADVQKIETVKPVGNNADDFVPAVGDVSGEKTEAEIRKEVAALIGKKERFYSRKGRIDPFEPFLRKPEPEVSMNGNSELKQRVPRTPLEKIDLSQLRLTAVLRTPTKTKALVQEASGKGYVINEGTYIGNKGGQVSKILKDRMMVEEKYLDVFGKISVREREMKLQQ
jgi:type IV pilus assembly protein PilP